MKAPNEKPLKNIVVGKCRDYKDIIGIKFKYLGAYILNRP